MKMRFILFLSPIVEYLYPEDIKKNPGYQKKCKSCDMIIRKVCILSTKNNGIQAQNTYSLNQKVSVGARIKYNLKTEYIK